MLSLPPDLKQLDFYIRKNEENPHSIVALSIKEGESSIGDKDGSHTEEERRKWRRMSFTFEGDEKVFGVESDHF